MRTHHISLNKGLQGYQFSLEPRMVDIVDMLKDQQAVNILDVGCGAGRHSRFLAKHAFSVYALDISKEALASFTANIHQSQSKFLSPLRSHFTALPLQTACMDAILCFSTIHHGFHREIVQTLQEVVRVLHPGGFLFLDILSQNDPSYGIGTTIEPHTFVGGRIGEENIPHHYVSQADLTKLLSAFELQSVEEVCYAFYINRKEPFTSIVFDVIARKPFL